MSYYYHHCYKSYSVWVVLFARLQNKRVIQWVARHEECVSFFRRCKFNLRWKRNCVIFYFIFVFHFLVLLFYFKNHSSINLRIFRWRFNREYSPTFFGSNINICKERNWCISSKHKVKTVPFFFFFLVFCYFQIFPKNSIHSPNIYRLYHKLTSLFVWLIYFSNTLICVISLIILPFQGNYFSLIRTLHQIAV